MLRPQDHSFAWLSLREGLMTSPRGHVFQDSSTCVQLSLQLLSISASPQPLTYLLADIVRSRAGFVPRLMTTWKPLLSSWINQEHPLVVSDDDHLLIIITMMVKTMMMMMQSSVLQMVMTLPSLLMLMTSLWINERRAQLIRTVGQELFNKQSSTCLLLNSASPPTRRGKAAGWFLSQMLLRFIKFLVFFGFYSCPQRAQ